MNEEREFDKGLEGAHLVELAVEHRSAKMPFLLSRALGQNKGADFVLVFKYAEPV